MNGQEDEYEEEEEEEEEEEKYIYYSKCLNLPGMIFESSPPGVIGANTGSTVTGSCI